MAARVVDRSTRVDVFGDSRAGRSCPDGGVQKMMNLDTNDAKILVVLGVVILAVIVKVWRDRNGGDDGGD